MNKKLIDWLSGSASFSPSSLSPLAWWDNGSAYMAADGSQWTDRIGGNNLTATGTARPTFTAGAKNGLPSFTFDGTTDVLLGPRLTSLQGITAFTFWLVGRRCTLAHDTGTGSTTSATSLFHYNVDNKIYFDVNNAHQPDYGTYTYSNSFFYAIMLYDGTQGTNATKMIGYVNGVAQTLSFTGTIATSTENNVLSLIRIGTFQNVFVPGECLEAGIVTRKITASEITNLNTYLASKYAI